LASNDIGIEVVEFVAIETRSFVDAESTPKDLTIGNCLAFRWMDIMPGIFLEYDWIHPILAMFAIGNLKR
jgi:hypothetical protein